MSIKVAQKWFHTKFKDFDTFTKIAKNVVDLGKLIVATGFEKLPKVQLIAQFGYTAYERNGWWRMVDEKCFCNFCVRSK